MKSPLPAGREDRRQDRSKAPHIGFIGFGKHYRDGLQALERVSIVRNQGSEVFGQSVEQSRGDVAKSVSGDEGCPDTANPSCQRSRLTSNVKRASRLPRVICRGAQRRHRSALGAAAACQLR